MRDPEALAVTERAREIVHRDISCPSCLSYALCKGLEKDYREALVAERGNWRNLYYPTGGRIGTPIRRCERAMIQLHRDLFQDSEVLEIGCGPRSDIDEAFCEAHNLRYLGIDPSPPPFEIPWLPLLSLQRRVFRRLVRWGLCLQTRRRRHIVSRFPSARLRGRQFDLIYANSSIEHWHEHLEDRDVTITAYQEDIRECYRLLRPGGTMMINAPLFVHGNRLFMAGDTKAVEAFFGEAWSSVVFEHWRENHGDLMPYCPEKRREVFRDQYGIDLVNIWILNILARKG